MRHEYKHLSCCAQCSYMGSRVSLSIPLRQTLSRALLRQREMEDDEEEDEDEEEEHYDTEEEVDEPRTLRKSYAAEYVQTHRQK